MTFNLRTLALSTALGLTLSPAWADVNIRYLASQGGLSAHELAAELGWLADNLRWDIEEGAPAIINRVEIGKRFNLADDKVLEVIAALVVLGVTHIPGDLMPCADPVKFLFQCSKSVVWNTGLDEWVVMMEKR